MMYTGSAVFALTGPVIAGHIVSEYGDNYLTVQLWSGLCLLLAALCMSVAWYYTEHGKTSLGKWRGSLSRFTSMEKDEKSNPVSRDMSPDNR